MNSTIYSKTYIDLFAGCGGLSLGLRNAGWNGLFAIEKDPMAFHTFENNFLSEKAPYPDFSNWPEWLAKKPYAIEDILEDTRITKELRKLKGGVTLVAGGPPCQGFSVAGSRRGDDPRNNLVFSQIELVKIVQPLAVLIENVEGFEKRFVARPNSSRVSVADEALDQLTKLNYSVAKLTVNAADYGVPQLRKRVVIIGIKREIAKNADVSVAMEESLKKAALRQRSELNLPLTRPVTVGEAIHDLSGDELVPCPDAKGFNTTRYITAESAYAILMRKGIPDGEIPNSHRFSNHGEKVRRLYEKAHATQKPGRLSKEFLLSNGCKSDKKVLLDPDSPCSTLTTHPDEFIHYKYPRNISLREMARIQSFPDDFWFYGRYTLNGPRRKHDVSRNAQIGNAVPPLMARAIGLALYDVLGLAATDQLEKEFPQWKLFK